MEALDAENRMGLFTINLKHKAGDSNSFNILSRMFKLLYADLGHAKF